MHYRTNVARKTVIRKTRVSGPNESDGDRKRRLAARRAALARSTVTRNSNARRTSTARSDATRISDARRKASQSRSRRTAVVRGASPAKKKAATRRKRR